MTRVLRVGGVDEPFNLPFVRAFEKASLAHLDVELTFTDFDGGTGALVKALEDESLDLATLLTEGAVTAIANGSTTRIHSAFVDSPLRWGIHVAAASDATSLDDLEGRRFGISRRGSGSELMAYVLADQQGWTLTPDQFVVVGGVDGALEALPAGNADIFLWERFVTAPHVLDGTFRRVDDLLTPWPPFYTVARPGLLGRDRALIDAVIEIILGEAAELKADAERTIDEIITRHDMAPEDARTWFEAVEWPGRLKVEHDVLGAVSERMLGLDRIAAPLDMNRALALR